VIIPMQEPPVQLRSMCHEDLASVSDIERRSYDFPWSHGVFRDCLLAGYQCVVLQREESEWPAMRFCRLQPVKRIS